MALDYNSAGNQFRDHKHPDEPDKAGIETNQRFGGDKDADVNGRDGNDNGTCGDRTPACCVAHRQYEPHA